MGFVAGLRGECEVVEVGGAERGVVDAVAFEAAVARDLPGLHAGEGVFDAGSHALVGGVVVFLPVRQAGVGCLAAMRDEHPGALITAVGENDRAGSDAEINAATPGQRQPPATVTGQPLATQSRTSPRYTCSEPATVIRVRS